MICKHCECDFNLNDRRKKDAGGLINECPDCLDELGGDQSAPKYLGVAAGNGKMSDLTILGFNSVEDREKYRKAFNNNSGQHKGKVCQLSKSATSMAGLKFKIVGENRANDNHKGKG